MCLVRSWNTGLEAMCRAAWLSQARGTGAKFVIPRSLNNVSNQTISQHVVAIARYSASAEERATTVCFLTFQDIGEWPSKMQKPVVDFLLSPQLPQSESQNPASFSMDWLERRIPCPGFDFKYLRTCLAAARCSSAGSCIY
uniref:Uncharacterized protein n=1 Tax=Opuntia streptacantha TaxID=393608 RepID=A0A7C9D5U8_OPUST